MQEYVTNIVNAEKTPDLCRLGERGQFRRVGHSGYASRHTLHEMQDGGLVRLPENVWFSAEGWKESDIFVAYLSCMLGVFYDLQILTVPTNIQFYYLCSSLLISSYMKWSYSSYAYQMYRLYLKFTMF